MYSTALKLKIHIANLESVKIGNLIGAVSFQDDEVNVWVMSHRLKVVGTFVIRSLGTMNDKHHPMLIINECQVHTILGTNGQFGDFGMGSKKVDQGNNRWLGRTGMTRCSGSFATGLGGL